MTLARRGFLKLLGAAPVAAPVVAREAAQKAGVGAVGLGMDDMVGPSNSGCYPSNPVSERDWISDAARRVFSKAWEDEQRETMRGWYPSRLDPDLAASRSLSLSAALRIQRDRNIENRIRREREDVQRNYKRVFGLEFLV